jgi:hypothetical protein
MQGFPDPSMSRKNSFLLEKSESKDDLNDDDIDLSNMSIKGYNLIIGGTSKN